jgi:hypothetical protein
MLLRSIEGIPGWVSCRRDRVLTMALGCVHVLYGFQRAAGSAFETYRFSNVLALDPTYQSLFGLLQLALGALMVLGRDPVNALLLGAMLNLALFVASTGVDGEEPRRAALRAVGWLVLHFAAALLEVNGPWGAGTVAATTNAAPPATNPPRDSPALPRQPLF